MQRKTNILHITSYLVMGGLETLIVEIGKKIDKSKFNLQVLCLNEYDQEYKDELAARGIPLHLIVKRNRYDIGYYASIVKLLKREHIDAVHIHSGCFFNPTLCSKYAKIKKIIYTEHGMPDHSRLRAYVQSWIAAAMADEIIAVTDEIAQDLKSKFWKFENKVKVIINGINTSTFKPVEDRAQIDAIKKRFGIPQDRSVIGTVGRLEKVKDYQMLMRALSHAIHDGLDNWHLVFIGDGSQRNALTEYADELGVTGHVNFLGMQHHVEKILPMLDVFALSSLSEGTSLALLEAQACGIPAVVTDVGGNGNIIAHGSNGYLCNSGDHIKMSEHIALILNDEAIAKKMRGNARATITSRFDISTMVKAYERLYVE